MPTKELDLLKAQADELGIEYHHRAGVEKIRGLIAAHVERGNADEAIAGVNPAELVKPMTSIEYRKNSLADRKRKVASLVRVQVQCMNPQKTNWEGEILSVGSAKLGSFKRYVPFNNVEWHIPKIIYDMMKERKCSSFYTERNELGHQVRKSRLINEFTIAVLPQLTKVQLSDLARTQAARAGQGN